MSGSVIERVALVAVLGTALLGASDAVAEGAGDHAVLFAVVAVLAVALLARPLTGRRTVTVREDLVRWLHRRSWLTGEPVPQLLDRAVAAYRWSITEDEAPADDPVPAVGPAGGGGPDAGADG